MKEERKFSSLNKRYMSDIDTNIVSDGKRYFVTNIHKWDGDKFFECFEVKKNLVDVVGNKKYSITPIYEEVDEDFQIVDYKVEEE